MHDEDRQRIAGLRDELIAAARPVSAITAELASIAERLDLEEMAALRSELAVYQRPYVEPRDFAARQPLDILEARLASTKVSQKIEFAAKVHEKIEWRRTEQIVARIRSHVTSLADAMLTRLLARQEKPWVMSLHGIRTRGKWQKDLSEELTPANFNYKELDYDTFDVMRFLRPGKRDEKIDWFRDEYGRFIAEHGVIPSIIAHSFGTLIVTRAIEKYGLEFNRIIFCGAIARRDFPWSDYIPDRVKRVLNDFGGRDVWARLVPWFVRDAGQSGLKAFSDGADGAVVQRGNRWLRHSDYFHRFNYTKRWIPFLMGVDPAPANPQRTLATNWRFYISIGALIGVLIAILWWLLLR